MAEHGYEATRETAFGPVGLVWGPVPARRSRALCVQEGSRVRVVAYFRNDEAYEAFTQAMRRLLAKEVGSDG